MSPPIVTVFGSLGNQGRSVVAAYLADEACQYRIRALTSNPSSLAAKALGTNPNITVVQVDVDSVDSLRLAFEGSTLIFANTVFDPAVFVKAGAAGAEKVEAQHGLNIARAASETLSLKHFIWSTLPDAKTWTNGKYVIPHFQSKIPAERYILSPESGLSGKSTFLCVGLYGSNLTFDPYQPLSSTDKDTRVLLLPCSSDAAFPFVGDEVENVGIFAKAIFQQPEKTLGRVVNGSAEMLSCGQWAAAFQNALNRKGGNFKVVSVGCTLQEFEEMWGDAGSEVGLMFKFFNEYGIHSYRGDTQDPEPLTASDLNIASQLCKTEECLAKIDWE